jgi:arsenite-transporting ATPase
VRILLFTGKGGVGKTTVAAATAVRAAKAGHRTLVTSTDPAHSLADSFGIPMGNEVVQIGQNLWAEQIDAQARLEANYRDIQEHVISLLNWMGVDSVEAEELSVIPGMDEIFALTDMRRHIESGQYDLMVVDCAPTAETLRLLSLPEVMNWYIERIFPIQRGVVKTIRPVLTRVTTMPIPDDRIFAAVARLHRSLEAVQRILVDDQNASVRLVVNPEKMVIAEARRTYTYLALFGYRVDSVIANRIIPDEVQDPYFAKWKDIHAEHLTEIEESFAPIPILRARLFEQELVGTELLERMGEEVYGDQDATAILHRDQPIRVRKRGEWYVLTMHLPFATRGELDIHRRGDELFVRVGSYKRNLVLPHALQRLDVKQARFVEDGLELRFAERSGQRAGTGST